MRLLISGGGIAGLTLALTLQRSGIDTLIVEKSAGPRDGGYMIDFYGPGYAAAEALGLIPDLAAIHYEIPELRFLQRDGRLSASIPYRVIRRRMFNDRHFNFMRGELERVLREHAARDTTIKYGTEIVAISDEGDSVRATLSDGTTEHCDLLAGADGIHSRVRALLFGNGAKRFLGYATAAFILDDPPPGLAHAFITLTEPSRQVSVYPIRGGRLATFFLHTRSEPVDDRSRAAAIDELRRVYGGMGWIVPDLLARLDGVPEIYFDDLSQIVLDRWSRDRAVLLGDAAWCVTVMAGQGASLAMGGAHLLARELARSPAARAFEAFEATMRPRVTRAQKSARSIAHWFLPESEWRVDVRNAMLRFATWPPIAYFYRRAMASGESMERLKT